jgi:hypothetical protein
MSNEKFTPGLWVTDRDTVESNQYTICQFFDKSENYFENKDANAALIAAAPAMYGALQKFCDRVDAGQIRSVTTYAEFQAILAAARGEPTE